VGVKYYTFVRFHSFFPFSLFILAIAILPKRRLMAQNASIGTKKYFFYVLTISDHCDCRSVIPLVYLHELFRFNLSVNLHLLMNNNVYLNRFMLSLSGGRRLILCSI